MLRDYVLIAFFIIIIGVVVSYSQDAAALTPSDLTGVWRTGGMSTTVERNTVTNATTPSNGSTFKYEFKANGRFSFVGYLESTMYGCVTELFNDKQGSYTLDGGQITLTPTKNFWRNTNSCSAASTKERNYTLESETYDISTKTDEYNKPYICLTNAKGETCYRRD